MMGKLSKLDYNTIYRIGMLNNMILWILGISGAGKTTIGYRMRTYFQKHGLKCYLIDGDEIRNLFNHDLGYSEKDREENIKRVILSAYFLDKSEIIGIICNISPFERLRILARSIIKGYNEIYLKRDIKSSIQNDIKGMYREHTGKTEIVGLDTIFDEPGHPDLVLDTDKLTEDETFQRVVEYVEAKYDVSGRG